MNRFDVLKKVSSGDPVGRIDIGAMMMETVEQYTRYGLYNEAKMLDLDIFGGECMRCGKPFRKVAVKNKYIEFDYFEPSCNCYPRCVWCDRPLHHEAESGQKHCTNCPAPRCPEWTEKTEWNNETKKKETKKHRCSGMMIIQGGKWVCDMCGAVKGTIEIRDSYKTKSRGII